MSAQSTRLHGRSPVAIRIRPALVIGAALLAVAVFSAIVIARARTSPVGAAGQSTKVSLSRADDYATRHMDEFAVTIPTLSYADDYATRHLAELAPAVPRLGFGDDQATRHLHTSVPQLGYGDDEATRHIGR